MKVLSDWDIKDFNHATKHANELSQATGKQYIPVDKGSSVAPQFSVTLVPQVGDKVSYAFNGDSYPDGEIEKISKTLKVITTSTGNKYYRNKLSGSWVRAKTWCLILGHHDERNPHF